jgi:protein-S-isoprenylcysteine O-methyltransferase Ste14
MTPQESFRSLVIIPWIVFLVYWLVGALKTRATRQQESFASRYTVLLVETVGYVLLFRNSSGIGFLGNRVFQRNLMGPIIGTAFIWMGIGLAIWARYHLAEYWSARVTIKEDHKLIRTGPYARLRHPIYTGLSLRRSVRPSSSTGGAAQWECAW